MIPYSKKVDTIAKKFITLCTSESLFRNKKLNPCYYAIRRYMETLEVKEINAIYDFLSELEAKTPMDIITLRNFAEGHRKKKISEYNRENVLIAPAYKEYDMFDLLQ